MHNLARLFGDGEREGSRLPALTLAEAQVNAVF